MIVDKQRPLVSPQDSPPAIPRPIAESEVEPYDTNALCEVYKAVKKILSDIRIDAGDPSSPALFRTIKVDNGQMNRLKNNKWNKEYGIAFPAVFIHFIDVRYLVQQSRIGEGRATMRVQYVLNRLNNSDEGVEMEGYELFQRINAAIQKSKGNFPALASRCQLTYFDQPESFDDGLQPYWIDYEIWFSDYSAYRYKDYVERYIVIPPFTDHDDQLPESNPMHHDKHGSPTAEEVIRLSEQEEK
jgi:hypothetical protein